MKENYTFHMNTMSFFFKTEILCQKYISPHFVIQLPCMVLDLSFGVFVCLIF